jgi:hypothetical protein
MACLYAHIWELVYSLISIFIPKKLSLQKYCMYVLMYLFIYFYLFTYLFIWSKRAYSLYVLDVRRMERRV